MRIDVITPSKLAFEGDCTLAVLPTPDGEVGVEDGHAYMMATLVPGEIRIYRQEASDVYAVSGGVIEVRPKRIIVLADAVESRAEIDVARAREAQERAEERLKSAGAEVDIDRAEAALARAINRIRVASRERPEQ